MGVSKVEFRGTTLIDISQDTVTAASLATGYTAHGSDGELITGTGSGAGAMAQGKATKGTNALGQETLTVTGLTFQPTGGAVMSVVSGGIRGLDNAFASFGIVRIANDWCFLSTRTDPVDGFTFDVIGATSADSIGTVEILNDGIRATITNPNYHFSGPNSAWYYDLRG